MELLIGILMLTTIVALVAALRHSNRTNWTTFAVSFSAWIVLAAIVGNI